MNESLVSIIMPSFNSAAYIAESIESILRQTYTDWELLVVDDCSADDTIAIVSRHTCQITQGLQQLLPSHNLER